MRTRNFRSGADALRVLLVGRNAGGSGAEAVFPLSWRKGTCSAERTVRSGAGEQTLPVKGASVLLLARRLPTGCAGTKGNVRGVQITKPGHAEIMRPAQWVANKRGRPPNSSSAMSNLHNPPKSPVWNLTSFLGKFKSTLVAAGLSSVWWLYYTACSALSVCKPWDSNWFEKQSLKLYLCCTFLNKS